MKNSLSKTLLCGIMATSFILANCQKAPNRGVKAGAPGAGVTDQVDTTQKIVACTPDYLAAYTETSKQQAKMGVQLKSIEDSENVTEVMKADMSKEIEELARLIKISEPAAVKLEADGCKCSTKTIIFKDVFG